MSFTVFAETRVKVDAVVSVKWYRYINIYISSRFIYSKIHYTYTTILSPLLPIF